MKRKSAKDDNQPRESVRSSRNRRKANRTDHFIPSEDSDDIVALSPPTITTPRTLHDQVTQSASKRRRLDSNGIRSEDDDDGSPTPRPSKNQLKATSSGAGISSSSNTILSLSSDKADRSARKRSIRRLLQSQEDDWNSEGDLAQEIAGIDIDGLQDERAENVNLQADAAGTIEVSDQVAQAETPSKRGRGRPKGSKNKRTPTPEGDIAPEERYFFQNRPGPPQVSNNSLSSLKLLTHEEYYDLINAYPDPHDTDRASLLNLHKRSFPQWRFELDQSFSVCLYGYGSKRNILTKFAEYISSPARSSPIIVIVNGYTPKLHIRSVLSTIASAVIGPDIPSRLGANPNEVASFILSYLSNSPPQNPVTLLVNSLDAPALRRPPSMSILARLASSPQVHFLATTDTPNFPLSWDSSICTAFNFVFHDCTTFAPYTAEINIVDDVHDLLGRKGRRLGGREGIAFVLKSLPENARNLYRVLVSEILTSLAESIEGDQEAEDSVRQEGTMEGESGVEYKLLYQKAVSEFICSSEMAFRTLLKEFQDHQMVVMRTGRGGGEVLGVPLGKEEMEGVLEDLILEAR